MAVVSGRAHVAGQCRRSSVHDIPDFLLMDGPSAARASGARAAASCRERRGDTINPPKRTDRFGTRGACRLRTRHPAPSSQGPVGAAAARATAGDGGFVQSASTIPRTCASTQRETAADDSNATPCSAVNGHAARHRACFAPRAARDPTAPGAEADALRTRPRPPSRRDRCAPGPQSPGSAPHGGCACRMEEARPGRHIARARARRGGAPREPVAPSRRPSRHQRHMTLPDSSLASPTRRSLPTPWAVYHQDRTSRAHGRPCAPSRAPVGRPRHAPSHGWRPRHLERRASRTRARSAMPRPHVRDRPAGSAAPPPFNGCAASRLRALRARPHGPHAVASPPRSFTGRDRVFSPRFGGSTTWLRPIAARREPVL